MSDTKTPELDLAAFSPMTVFRDWIAKSEAQWSQTVGELMKDPRASGMLNRQIDEARMMQRMFAEFAQASLAMANLPSRSDVEGLDERMGRVEDGLAALSAEVVRLREALGTRVAAPAPSRNRTAGASTVRAEPVEAQQASLPASRAPKGAAKTKKPATRAKR